MVKTSVLFLFLACGLAAGCGDGDSTDPVDEGTGGSGGSGGSGGGAPGQLEIEGDWVSEYGSETIGGDYWESTVAAVIVEYSNQENYAVFRNPEDAEFNPGKYGRNVWTEIDDNSFYYCTVAYMSETADATEHDAESADSSDPENGGCGSGDFPWTKLSRIEIAGTFTSDFGTETITNDSWEGAGSSAIVEFSNDENYAVWQNPDDAMYNPGKFGRNVWTELDDGSFYYCTVAYMSDTAEATEDDAEPADASDPDVGGCGASDFPWTKLTRQ